MPRLIELEDAFGHVEHGATMLIEDAVGDGMVLLGPPRARAALKKKQGNIFVPLPTLLDP